MGYTVHIGPTHTLHWITAQLLGVPHGLEPQELGVVYDCWEVRCPHP